MLGIGGYVHFIAALIRSFAVSLANTICAVIVYKVYITIYIYNSYFLLIK